MNAQAQAVTTVDDRAYDIVPKNLQPAVKELVTRLADLSGAATNLVVDSAEAAASGAALSADLKRIGKEIEEKRKESTRPLDDAKKQIMTFYGTFSDLAKNQAQTVDAQLRDYQRAEDERRRKLAEQERKRLEKLAEQRAARAEKKGDEEKAEEIREEAAHEAELVESSISAPTRVDGMHTRKNYRAEVTDFLSLLRAVADGHPQAPVGVITVNMAELNKMARALKESLNIPGVRVVVDETIITR